MLYVQNKARYFLGPFPSSVYKALITADRTSLTIDWRNRINDLGITHLFAISGMHIGILFLWFSLVIRWLVSFPCTWVEKGASVFLTDLVSITAIFVFLRVIGMPISAERSFIMLVWWALMRHFLRWQPLWFILCGTGMIILVGSPIAIGQKSFQLSFLSVAGIIQILPFLPRRRIQDSLGSALRKLVLSSLFVSAWLCLLTLPLVSQLAENVSLISAFNNVIHIFYLSFVFLPCSLLVMVFTVLGYPWGGLPGELYLYSLLNFVGKIWERGLVLNSEWNRYFLIKNFKEWPLFSTLVWFVLFLTPFFIKWMACEKRKT
ncbi:ComEC/Rec2 family competence protein [bacterium]|nr:ComEC/Rec2 family competence protein [bacterium]